AEPLFICEKAISHVFARRYATPSASLAVGFGVRAIASTLLSAHRSPAARSAGYGGELYGAPEPLGQNASAITRTNLAASLSCRSPSVQISADEDRGPLRHRGLPRMFDGSFELPLPLCSSSRSRPSSWRSAPIAWSSCGTGPEGSTGPPRRRSRSVRSGTSGATGRGAPGRPSSPRLLEPRGTRA